MNVKVPITQPEKESMMKYVKNFLTSSWVTNSLKRHYGRVFYSAY